MKLRLYIDSFWATFNGRVIRQSGEFRGNQGRQVSLKWLEDSIKWQIEWVRRGPWSWSYMFCAHAPRVVCLERMRVCVVVSWVSCGKRVVFKVKRVVFEVKRVEWRRERNPNYTRIDIERDIYETNRSSARGRRTNPTHKPNGVTERTWREPDRRGAITVGDGKLLWE